MILILYNGFERGGTLLPHTIGLILVYGIVCEEEETWYLVYGTAVVPTIVVLNFVCGYGFEGKREKVLL